MQTQVFNIVLPKDLVDKAERIAKSEYKNRSELIREALRVYIEDKEEWQEVFAFSEKAMKQMKRLKNRSIVTRAMPAKIAPIFSESQFPASRKYSSIFNEKPGK